MCFGISEIHEGTSRNPPGVSDFRNSPTSFRVLREKFPPRCLGGNVQSNRLFHDAEHLEVVVFGDQDAFVQVVPRVEFREVAVHDVNGEDGALGVLQNTQGEWEQLKAWLRVSPPSTQGQTAAVQWWSSQYSVPRPEAYYHINVLQAGLMTGHLQ